MATKRRSKKRVLEDYKYVMCRSFGHSWRPVDVDRKPMFGYLVSLECRECTMLRHDIINQLGQVGSRSYKQPDGYRNPEHSQRAEYRRELIDRSLGK